MKLAGKDWLFIAVIAVLLGALFVGTGRDKAKNLPGDERHSRFYDAMHQGGERAEVEKGCAACHGIPSAPLPKSHPPKEQCLLCHKLSPDNRQGPSRM